MGDDLDDLGRRIDRIEHALRRSPDGPARTPAGPEIRSARSIVKRVDDVWVAVTEGNERVAAAIHGLRVELGRLTAALHAPDQSQDPADLADPAEPGSGAPELRMPEFTLPGTGDAAELNGRMQRIEEALAQLGESAEPDPAVHLRLNRVEEALAGIAARLEELATSLQAQTQPAASDRGGSRGMRTAVDAMGDEVRGLANRVDGLAQALEASAARSADGTLAERLGRLRDQFRR